MFHGTEGGRVRRVAALALLAALGGCTGQSAERRLAVRPILYVPDSAPVGVPVEVEYRWVPAPEFTAPAHDYKVFLHLRDPDNEVVYQDDHYPPVPTSQWKADEPVVYRRWLYLPPTLQPEYLEFHVGLYDDDGKVAVQGPDGWDTAPRIRRMVIRPDDLGGMPIFVEGWHGEEVAQDDPARRWHWMERRGVVAFANPRGAALLHLEARSPVGEVGGSQTVTLTLGGQALTTLRVSNPAPFLRRIPVPAEMLGDDDWVELAIEVDRWFVPAEVGTNPGDNRELGLQVFRLYLQLVRIRAYTGASPAEVREQ